MQDWFLDAKLGIFIHWGIYAVKGIAESWSFYLGQVTYDEYMQQLNGFTAKNYNPNQWADLFVNSGAKYAVLTSKHHDGVSLFDTKLSELSVVKKTPAGRDLIALYCAALRKRNLKVGLYFSHLDWSHPDYATVFSKEHKSQLATLARNRFRDPKNDIEDYARWERFLKFHRGQIKEILTTYKPLDLFWFDGDWERDVDQWKMKELREYIEQLSPGTIINSRMLGYGDYSTPEQALPVVSPNGPWEFCMTINNSWGYQGKDTEYKSVRQIIRMFADCIGLGGNLLLDIGPKEDGTIVPEQEQRLLELGKWIKKHEPAIYSTIAGLPPGLFNGASTLSKDRKTLYLFCFDRPWESIAVKGMLNDVKRATVLGSGTELKYKKLGGAPWAGIPGILWIEVPEPENDQYCTVIKLEFEEPISINIKLDKLKD
ncbi:MAG: alpha-L-fucosidase [bacterium]